MRSIITKAAVSGVAVAALGMLAASGAVASPTHAGEDIRAAQALLGKVSDGATRGRMEALIAQAEQAARDRNHDHAHVLARRAVDAGELARRAGPADVQVGQR
jgi:hypothetical protein